VYNSYFESFPKLKDHFEEVMTQTINQEFILFNNVTGRKLFLRSDEPLIKYKEVVNSPYFFQHPEAREIMKEYETSMSEIQRKAQNYPIQGSSADISKLAGIIFFNQLKNRKLLFLVKIVNMVHDEYNIEAPDDIAEEMASLLVKCMAAAGDQFCKIIKLGAVADIGTHWIH